MSFKHRHEMPQGNLEMQEALEMGKNNIKVMIL